VQKHDDKCKFVATGSTHDLLSQTRLSLDRRMKMRVWSTNDGLHLNVVGVDGKIVASMHCTASWLHPHVQILSSGSTLKGCRHLFSTIYNDLYSSIPMYRISENHLKCCMPTHTCDLSQAIRLISSMNLRGERGRPVGKKLTRLGVVKPLDSCATPDTEGVSCFDNNITSVQCLHTNARAVVKLQTAGFSQCTISSLLQAAIAVDVHNSKAVPDRLIVLTSTCGIRRDEYVRGLLDTIVGHGAHDSMKIPVYYKALLHDKVSGLSTTGVVKLAVVAHDVVCFFDDKTDNLQSVYVGDVAHRALAAVIRSNGNRRDDIMTPLEMSNTLSMIAPHGKNFCLHRAALRLIVLNNLALSVPELAPLHRTLRCVWFSTEMNSIKSESSATHCAHVHILSTLAKMPLESNNLWATLPQIAATGVY
jgi:hypothetical protein